jgi:hypothetical protein
MSFECSLDRTSLHFITDSLPGGFQIVTDLLISVNAML